jgi:phage FluMu gp28-like protein
MSVSGDVIRILDWEELPASVRELPKDKNPIADGLLMKHQVEWCKQIHEADLNIVEKGRRTGITYATALDDTITASSSRTAGGDHVYYVGDTKDKGLEFIGYCAHMAKVMAASMAKGWAGIEVFLFEDQDKEGNTRQITSYRIRFASGFHIVALSSNPANIRGLQGIVNIDEAAFHKDVGAVIEACLALVIWGGKIRIISTHNGVKNPFNQLILDSRAGLYAFKVFHVTFDDAVANGLYERVCMIKGWRPTLQGKREWYEKVRKGYGTRKAAMLEELDAIPREGSGVAIPGVLVEKCMTEERPIVRLAMEDDFLLQSLEARDSWIEEFIRIHIDPLFALLNPELEHVFGSDYSRYCDFASFGPMAIEQNLTRKVPWMLEMHNVPTRHQQQIIFHIIRCLPRFRCGAMDATGNGFTIAEYTADEFGYDRIFMVKFNDAWFRENMEPFVQAFEDGTIDLPRDADVKNDIRALERIDGVVKLPKLRQADTKDSKLKRHGDAAISAALGHFASRSDVESFGYIPVKHVVSEDDDPIDRPVSITAGFRSRGGVL